jgi:hypothetical protein
MSTDSALDRYRFSQNLRLEAHITERHPGRQRGSRLAVRARRSVPATLIYPQATAGGILPPSRRLKIETIPPIHKHEAQNRAQASCHASPTVSRSLETIAEVASVDCAATPTSRVDSQPRPLQRPRTAGECTDGRASAGRWIEPPLPRKASSGPASGRPRPGLFRSARRDQGGGWR